jgi:hypothetical protein
MRSNFYFKSNSKIHHGNNLHARGGMVLCKPVYIKPSPTLHSGGSIMPGIENAKRYTFKKKC